MAYNKTVWVNNTTPVNADNMNKIENQLETLDTGKLDKANVVNTTTQTESEGKALNAVQLNPNISGTLANKAKVLNDDRGYLDSKEYSGDLNSLVANGIYRTSTSTTNKPLSTSDRFTVFVMKDSNTTTQLAICSYSVAFANSNRAFTRVMIDGSWSEWKEIKTVDFRSLSSLGLSDDNMSATDFGSNLAAILNAMPQYGTFKNYIYNSTPNLFASINTTAIATSDGYMLEIQKTANNTVPNKVILHPNTSSGVVREQVGYYDNAWGGWQEIATTTVAIPTPANGWTQYKGHQQIKLIKTGKLVNLVGFVNVGVTTSNTIMLTGIPLEFRPSAVQAIRVADLDVRVSTDGTMVLMSSKMPTYNCYNGICWEV